MSLNDALRTAGEAAAQRDWEIRRDRLIEYHTAIYDSASRYDNAVIVAGYAAFFALWAGTSADLNSFVRLITVALIGLSLMAYLGSVIGQMLVRQGKEWQYADALGLPDTKRMVQRIESITRNWEAKQGPLLKLWMRLFWLSLVTGFAGGGLLTYTALASAFGWPVLTGNA